jgi:hypothetical protein
MKESEKNPEKEVLKKLVSFVMEEMKAGADKSAISQKLVEMGIDEKTAVQLVETIYNKIAKTAEKERFTFASILPALLGGVMSAVAGGVIWGLIVIATGYEIGYMAWGTGLLCGFAVLLFSKGKRGIPLQTIAVLSSILGIIIGKYFTFFHFFKEAVAKEYGVEAVSRISILSERVIKFFLENAGSIVSGFDILWIALAVITAWRIPKGTGIKLKEKRDNKRFENEQ